MATRLSHFLRQLTRGMAAEAQGDRPDRELVEQFLAGQDESVFEAIVRRHGPMVYRVCWRVLQQEQDSEDAFQAVFLLLAQRLSSVRKQESLASWLHGVARRVALKAKARAANRRRHEQDSSAHFVTPTAPASWEELRSVLDQELARLPENWRQVLVLCYLEGRTQDEAAAQLGWSKSTLRRRLDDARAALGRRLQQRGVGPEALSAVLLSDCLGPAPAPALIGATVEIGTRIAAGQASAVLVSANILDLLEGIMTTSPLRKLSLALVLLLAFGVAGVGIPHYQGAPAPLEPRKKDQPAVVPARKLEDSLPGQWLMTLPRGFQYQVVVRQVGQNRYSLEKAVRFSGVYELQGKRLVLVAPLNPRERDFIWEVGRAGELKLVAQPPVGKVGSNYLGATLARQPN